VLEGELMVRSQKISQVRIRRLIFVKDFRKKMDPPKVVVE